MKRGEEIMSIDMKAKTISLTGLGIEVNIPTTGVDAIKLALKQLQSPKFKPVDAKELLWDIKLYQWILDQPDAEQKAAAYFRARNFGRENRMPRNKRDVAAELGWVIE